jgi:hypothetical protein
MMVDGAEEGQLKGPIDVLAPYSSPFRSARSGSQVLPFSISVYRCRLRRIPAIRTATTLRRPPTPWRFERNSATLNTAQPVSLAGTVVGS